ncbi:MAG: HNH endonuclease [Spirochaetota bacterium]|nr:HNH endonuclease [Spirochaetota bacterium]
MRVLLLNATYEPIKIISWQKTMILYFNHKVEILEEYNGNFIHSERLTFRVPAVVRLKKYVNIHKFLSLRFSKENIFYRDQYTCAYCGRQFSKNYLTLDHVIPLSRGGKKTWKNIVTACYTCNNKKADKIPDQHGFKLLKNPVEPPVTMYLNFYIKLQSVPKEWETYLPA